MLRAAPGLRRINPARSRVHHLVDRRRRHEEVAMHVGFHRGLPEHARIDVDEGEILALLFGEAKLAGVGRSA